MFISDETLCVCVCVCVYTYVHRYVYMYICIKWYTNINYTNTNDVNLGVLYTDWRVVVSLSVQYILESTSYAALSLCVCHGLVHK